MSFKKITFLAVFIAGLFLYTSVVSATTYSGEGTYDVVEGDKIVVGTYTVDLRYIPPTINPVYKYSLAFAIYTNGTTYQGTSSYLKAGEEDELSVMGTNFYFKLNTMTVDEAGIWKANVTVDGDYQSKTEIKDVSAMSGTNMDTGVSSVYITWESNKTIAHATVYYCLSSPCQSPKEATVQGGFNYVDIKNLDDGATYYYKIQAEDVSGQIAVYPANFGWTSFTTAPANNNENGSYDEESEDESDNITNQDNNTNVEEDDDEVEQKPGEEAKTEADSATNQVDVNKLEKEMFKGEDKSLESRLAGKILLQVENHGEAWYVDTNNYEKYYLKDGAVAYQALRKFGLGVANRDLAKIPVGLESRFSDIDTDGDGLPDKLEEGLKTDPKKSDTDGDGYSDSSEIKGGYDPLASGSAKLSFDNSLVNRLSGKILLQVESRGEAWYVNPTDGKRYYMKDGDAAYQIMRFLSLGINNNDLRKIKVGDL